MIINNLLISFFIVVTVVVGSNWYKLTLIISSSLITNVFSPSVNNEDSIVKYILSVVAKRQAIDFEKTGRLRKNLIKNDRFSLDYVKPKLDSKWQKFVIKFMSVI